MKCLFCNHKLYNYYHKLIRGLPTNDRFKNIEEYWHCKLCEEKFCLIGVRFHIPNPIFFPWSKPIIEEIHFATHISNYYISYSKIKSLNKIYYYNSNYERLFDTDVNDLLTPQQFRHKIDTLQLLQ